MNRQSFSILSLFLLFTELAQAKFIDMELLKEYEEFSLAFILLISVAFLILLYLTITSKKLLKQQYKILFQKEMNIKQLKESRSNQELIWVNKEHAFEKKIFELEQEVKELERSKKEGLKSQVVTKIEEYQNRREKVLEKSEIL